MNLSEKLAAADGAGPPPQTPPGGRPRRGIVAKATPGPPDGVESAGTARHQQRRDIPCAGL